MQRFLCAAIYPAIALSALAYISVTYSVNRGAKRALTTSPITDHLCDGLPAGDSSPPNNFLSITVMWRHYLDSSGAFARNFAFSGDDLHFWPLAGLVLLTLALCTNIPYVYARLMPPSASFLAKARSCAMHVTVDILDLVSFGTYSFLLPLIAPSRLINHYRPIKRHPMQKESRKNVKFQACSVFSSAWTFQFAMLVFAMCASPAHAGATDMALATVPTLNYNNWMEWRLMLMSAFLSCGIAWNVIDCVRNDTPINDDEDETFEAHYIKPDVNQAAKALGFIMRTVPSADAYSISSHAQNRAFCARLAHDELEAKYNQDPETRLASLLGTFQRLVRWPNNLTFTKYQERFDSVVSSLAALGFKKEEAEKCATIQAALKEPSCPYNKYASNITTFMASLPTLSRTSARLFAHLKEQIGEVDDTTAEETGPSSIIPAFTARVQIDDGVTRPPNVVRRNGPTADFGPRAGRGGPDRNRQGPSASGPRFNPYSNNRNAEGGFRVCYGCFGHGHPIAECPTPEWLRDEIRTWRESRRAGGPGGPGAYYSGPSARPNSTRPNDNNIGYVVPLTDGPSTSYGSLANQEDFYHA